MEIHLISTSYIRVLSFRVGMNEFPIVFFNRGVNWKMCTQPFVGDCFSTRFWPILGFYYEGVRINNWSHFWVSLRFCLILGNSSWAPRCRHARQRKRTNCMFTVVYAFKMVTEHTLWHDTSTNLPQLHLQSTVQMAPEKSRPTPPIHGVVHAA